MLAIPVPKKTATVTIEPIGPRSTGARDHSIKVAIGLGAGGGDDTDTERASRVARKSLAPFPPPRGEPDGRKVAGVSVSRKAGRGAPVTSVVVAVEGSVVWPSRPEESSVADVRTMLLGEGYRVLIREKRECAEPACHVEAVVEWNETTAVPSGWYSELVCGRHSYRTCQKCGSTFRMMSSNFVGPAPSLHCEVCGWILVEWGSSKLWIAELVTRREAVARAR
jgi:hypothetical protein